MEKNTNVGIVQIADDVVAIIAGLAADGITEIEDIYHIERGYDCMEKKLRELGADIEKKSFPDEAVPEKNENQQSIA